MRSVSSRLGVSPVPLYSRIGNKDALVDAIADRLLADLAPPRRRRANRGTVRACVGRGSSAPGCAGHATAGSSSRPGREAYVEASRPLVDAMRRDGFEADAAVQACRLLMWATVGFGAVESGVEPSHGGGRRGAVAGAADPEATRVA